MFRLSPRKLSKGFFQEFLREFYILRKLVLYAPYWSHVFEFWNRRNEPNVIFVWYEEMKENLRGVITRLADFLAVPQPSTELMQQLLHHLSFESMKQNPSVNNFLYSIDVLKNTDDPENSAFIRKGTINQWKEKMSAKLTEKFDAWINKNTEGTDFEFYEAKSGSAC